MMRYSLMLFFVMISLGAFAQKAADFTKLGTSIQKKLQSLKEQDSVNVSIMLKSNQKIISNAFHLQEKYTSAHIYQGRVSKRNLFALIALPEVVFINESHRPKEELNTGAVDYTLNKINKARHVFPLITGDSVYITVKERAFDTTDIDFKGRTFSTGLQAAMKTAHAAVMATIIAGAGNSSPYAQGVASSSFVGSVDFANLFPEPDAFYQQKKITVQNHSYGTVVENFYGNEAVAYDVSANNHHGLLHVFSAGNSGGITPTGGTYAGIAGAANLTGNFKQSKNSLVVTALDSSGSPMAAASKGPAFDGRVKPELAAYGEDGSSGAAAMVSGTAALLQDAYKKLHGQLPSSDLVRSVLINSADEAGAAGIDYLTGYGSLNAYKAVETVVQNRIFSGSLSHNEVKTFSLSVPANTAKLRLTLSWTDPAAQPNVAKTLINDLDLSLKEMLGGQSWLPWVLNSNPHKDSLLLTAQRKRDTLNTNEQITVDAPAAGIYQIEVKGTKIITSQQKFAISYQLDTAANFTWDYPTGSDALVAAKTATLRWSTSMGGNGILQYSLNGLNWITLSSSVELATKQFRWPVPDTLSTALLRMTIGTNEFRSDTFVISPQLGLHVGFNCNDSFLLYWNKLPGASYRLYTLGANYLEPVRTVTDTTAILNKSQTISRYYSLAPVTGNKTGIRSHTIPYDAAGVDCYLISFYLESQTFNTVTFKAELGTLIGVKQVSLQKLIPAGFVSIQTNTSFASTVLRFADASLLKGENLYRLQITLMNGSVLYSRPETVYHFAESPVYVYPNPVRQGERLKIISNESGRYTVRILNSDGAEVYRQFITNSFISLAATRLPKGLYFLWVMDQQGKPFVQKIIIQ